MSDCIRCHQPITQGDFYIPAYHLPTDTQTVIAAIEDPPTMRRSVHVTCPPNDTRNDSIKIVVELFRKHQPVDPTNIFTAVCICGQWAGMATTFTSHLAEVIVSTLEIAS